jgi:hypothetical protein
MGATVLVFASRLCAVTRQPPRPHRIRHHLKRVISCRIHPVRVIPPARAAVRIERAAAQAAANDREEPQ